MRIGQFGLSEQQLKSWERQNLIAAAAAYSFSDLLTIKTLIRLRENKVPVREIARALDSRLIAPLRLAAARIVSRPVEESLLL